MTTRKLTPAEALECLRDWRSTTMSLMEHRRKWGQLELDGLFRIAIAALEEALAQKHPAAPVKRGRCRIRQLLVDALNDGDKEATSMLQQALLWRMRQPAASEKPAAPVPSDEVIVKAITSCLARPVGSDGAEDWMRQCIVLLARRIGVQGVPQ